jgi:hypothetical protein
MKKSDQSRIFKFWTKSPTVFRGIFKIFRCISEFLYIYSTIFRESPRDALRSPEFPQKGKLEELFYTKVMIVPTYMPQMLSPVSFLIHIQLRLRDFIN